MKVKASLTVLLAVVIFPGTLFITYITALCDEHVIPFWPYISHTGDVPIESCFFSLGINVVSGLYALIVYIRYNQIRYLLASDTSKFHKCLNESSLAWGMTSAFALSMTCSFQQRNIVAIHMIAAVICSYGALCYFWHQTIFSYIMSDWTKKRVKIFRTVLSIISTILHSAGPVLFFYALAVHRVPGYRIIKWGPDVGTVVIYLIGSLMEWFVFVLNEMYIASFYWEFKNINLKSMEIEIIRGEVHNV